MRHIGAHTTVVQFALPAPEARRLTSFLPEIVAKLRPGASIQKVNDHEIRVGSKGSLAVYAEGGWMDYEADRGGHGAAAWLVHELGPREAHRYALDWLATHPGAGSFSPDQISESATRERAEQHARWAQQVVATMQRNLAGTDSGMNLGWRGLPGPYPVGLLGHLQNARLGESALVALLTGLQDNILGVQLGYLTPGGRKSVLVPARNLFWITLDPEERKTALFRISASQPNGEDPLPDATLLVEGVEKAIAVHDAFPCVRVIGVPGIGRLRHIPPIPGVVLVVRDGDEPGSKADKSLVRGIDHLLLTGTEAVRVTATPRGQDADGILLSEGIDALRALILAAPTVPLSGDGEAQRIAAIADPLARDVERVKVAKRLGVRRSVLEDAVNAKRRVVEGEESSPDKATALGPEPWPAPVHDIAAVLDTASATIAIHLVAPQAVCDIAALWALHTHFVHHWGIVLPISPRLEIRAVSPICGKTTLLRLVRHLVWQPLPMAASLTPAVVYRTMDELRPTMLLDEIDGVLRAKQNDELRGVLRASHERSEAFVPRLVPTPEGGFELKLFSVWGTYAYTAIGQLEPALQSRAISLVLLRARPDELKRLHHLVDGLCPILADCGRKFARWAQDQLALPDAEIPDIIAYRDHDNWRPLFRLAEHIGKDWLQRTRQAAIAINGITVAVGDVVPLLTDTREVLGVRERISYQEWSDGLLALAEPSEDWSRAYKGQPITPYYLRERVKGLVVAPAQERRWRDGQRTVRGFLKVHFQDAFERYLPPEDDGAAEDFFKSPPENIVTIVTNVTPLNHNEKSVNDPNPPIVTIVTVHAADSGVTIEAPFVTMPAPTIVTPETPSNVNDMAGVVDDVTMVTMVSGGRGEKEDIEIWLLPDEDC